MIFFLSFFFFLFEIARAPGVQLTDRSIKHRGTHPRAGTPMRRAGRIATPTVRPSGRHTAPVTTRRLTVNPPYDCQYSYQVSSRGQDDRHRQNLFSSCTTCVPRARARNVYATTDSASIPHKRASADYDAQPIHLKSPSSRITDLLIHHRGKWSAAHGPQHGHDGATLQPPLRSSHQLTGLTPSPRSHRPIHAAYWSCSTAKCHRSYQRSDRFHDHSGEA